MNIVAIYMTPTSQICLGQRKIESQDYKSAGGEFLPAIPTNFAVLSSTS